MLFYIYTSQNIHYYKPTVSFTQKEKHIQEGFTKGTVLNVQFTLHLIV